MDRIWFKAKPVGWGWTPATWQGWLVTALFFLLVAASSFAILGFGPTVSAGQWTAFFVATPIEAAMFVLLCYKFGERPRWRW